jgi:hypothetical protein
MDALSGYYRAKAAKEAGKDFMVFDWDKAAKLIRERKPEEASAGLRSDWSYTGGVIYQAGDPVTTDNGTYLASLWAEPELDMDGDVVECWRFQKDSPNWNENTKWPESALEILRK